MREVNAVGTARYVEDLRFARSPRTPSQYFFRPSVPSSMRPCACLRVPILLRPRLVSTILKASECGLAVQHAILVVRISWFSGRLRLATAVML